MFMRLFGKDDDDQIRGLVGFCMLVILFTVVGLVMYQPEFGGRTSSRTLNMDMVTGLIAMFNLLVGYFVGSKGKKKECKNPS